MLFRLSSFLWICSLLFVGIFHLILCVLCVCVCVCVCVLCVCVCARACMCMCVCVSGKMLYLGMNGMLGLAWVTFLDCIGFLVSAQADLVAPCITYAIGNPMHVLVRNELPFHLCCLIRHFLQIKMHIFYAPM